LHTFIVSSLLTTCPGSALRFLTYQPEEVRRTWWLECNNSTIPQKEKWRLGVRLLCIETDIPGHKTRINSDALSNVSGGPSALLRRISSHTEKLQYGDTRQENSVTGDPSIGGILNAQAW